MDFGQFFIFSCTPLSTSNNRKSLQPALNMDLKISIPYFFLLCLFSVFSSNQSKIGKMNTRRSIFSAFQN